MALFDGTTLQRPVRCEICLELQSDCRCQSLDNKDSTFPKSAQRIRLRIEKRKGSKSVSVICGLRGTDSQLSALLSHLKQACGTGGTRADENLELQGDQLERLKPLLTGLNYRIAN